MVLFINIMIAYLYLGSQVPDGGFHGSVSTDQPFNNYYWKILYVSGQCPSTGSLSCLSGELIFYRYYSYF